MPPLEMTAAPSPYADEATRVSFGMAYLDRVSPGWETKIDLTTLNISSSDSCICGQLAFHRVLGDVHWQNLKGANIHAIDAVNAEYLFLMSRNSDATAHGFTGGMNITAEWQRQIALRRLQAVAA